MDKPLKLLIVEDSEDDALLVIRNLQRGGFAPDYKIVETAGALGKALEDHVWDIIISDYSLPAFNAFDALNFVKDKKLDLPFIIVSGTIGEESAVECMKAGANDYIMKDKLAKLSVSVERELKEASIRRELMDAKKTLRKSELKYSTLVQAISDLIFIIDLDGKLSYLNPEFEIFTGYSIDDFIGCPLADILAPEYTDTVVDLLKQNFFALEIPVFEIEFKHKDGSNLAVELKITSLLDDDGNISGRIGLARDIIERKKTAKEKKILEAQLQQAQKMETIGTLAGGIAHDFNNILSAIIGYTEIAIVDELSENSRAKSSLKEVLKAGLRAKDLVNQILAFSRQSKFKKKQIDLIAIIKETLKLLKVATPANIEIRQDINTKENKINADATQVLQILLNICTNGIYAMRKKGGKLDVKLSTVNIRIAETEKLSILEPGNYFRITITDTGLGMERLTMERIFDPFFTTKPKEEGTGLGLSVVHGIIKEHGGHITVESEIDKGTIFDIYLPMIENRGLLETEHSIPIQTGTERILLVDDEKKIVDSMCKVLESLGYHVTSMSSSRKMLETFQQHPERFDLIITDQTMPEITGDVLAKQILSIRNNIPIVLCTGFSHEITEDYAKSIGIKEFVMKPILRRELAEAVRRAIDSDGLD